MSIESVITLFILEKGGKDFQKILNTLWCAMVTSLSLKLHNDVTDRRTASMRLLVFIIP